MRFIKLYTAENSFEANFLKDDLKEAGIECILTNENFTDLMPHMNGMLGSGIQVLVHKNDIETARQILDKKAKAEISSCPYCGSHNIEYGLGTTHKLKRVIAIMISLILASPSRHIGMLHYCRDCKSELGR